jgi:hypothetical protein
MKPKVLLTLVAAVAFSALPLASFAAEESQGDQDAELNKLLTEMNTAPADQKIGAITTLLNKLVEMRKTAQQTSAPKAEKCMCCDMMKSDQSEHQHQH